MAKVYKIKDPETGATQYPVTVADAVFHPTTKKSITTEIDDLSQLTDEIVEVVGGIEREVATRHDINATWIDGRRILESGSAAADSNNTYSIATIDVEGLSSIKYSKMKMTDSDVECCIAFYSATPMGESTHLSHEKFSVSESVQGKYELASIVVPENAIRARITFWQNKKDNFQCYYETTETTSSLGLTKEIGDVKVSVNANKAEIDNLSKNVLNYNKDYEDITDEFYNGYSYLSDVPYLDEDVSCLSPKHSSNLSFRSCIADVKKNDKIKFSGIKGNSARSNILVYVASGKIKYIYDDSSATDVVIDITDDGYVIYNTKSESPYIKISSYAKGIVTRMSEVESAIRDMRYKPIESLTGFPCVRKNIASLSANLPIALTGYPYHNKVGEMVVARMLFEDFGTLLIGKNVGSSEDNSCWVVINSTNAKIYVANVEKKTFTHGLSISKYINVCLFILDSGRLQLKISTLGDNGEISEYKCDTEYWDINAKGVWSLQADIPLTNVYLSATNKYFRSPLWIFGASYESLKGNDRWIQHIKSLGFTNFLVNAYSGRDSEICYADFMRALYYGCPKYLYWTMWGNGTASDLDLYIGKVKEICDARGITLIIIDRPNTPSCTDYAERKAVIDKYSTMGVRIVNSSIALSSNPSSQTGWYEGYLYSDNKHTTNLGAEALAMQVLVDLPEIMYY